MRIGRGVIPQPEPVCLGLSGLGTPLDCFGMRKDFMNNKHEVSA